MCNFVFNYSPWQFFFPLCLFSRCTKNCFQINVCFMRVTDNLIWNPIFPHCSWQDLVAAAATGETGYKQRRWKARQQKPVWDAIAISCRRYPTPPSPPSPSLKLSEAMCSLHYKGFCSRMRHPSLPSDVIFLYLPLTRSQFLRTSQRQGSILHLPEYAEMLSIHADMNRKAIRT